MKKEKRERSASLLRFLFFLLATHWMAEERISESRERSREAQKKDEEEKGGEETREILALRKKKS